MALPSLFIMSKRDDDDASWSNIDFNEIELGDRIGGGGAGIIYQGEIISIVNMTQL